MTIWSCRARLRSVLGRALPTAVCVVVLAVMGAAGAYATTITGTQNPQFRVRVSITPVHPTLGQTIVAHFSIRNMTGHALNGEWQFTWSTPRNGIGAAIVLVTTMLVGSPLLL